MPPRILVLLACLIAGGALLAPAFPAAGAEAPGIQTIRRGPLLETVTFLASSKLQGRLAGSPGYMAAARGMAERFWRLGLRPGGDGAVGGGVVASYAAAKPAAYFQGLAVEYAEITECACALVLPDGSTRPLRLGPDFTCRGLTGSGDFTAPVVFAGYGLSSPESGYDDYAGIDARGKIVLAFKEAPPFAVDSLGWGVRHLPRPKGLVAAAHGAVALLLVSRPNQARPQRPIASLLEGDGEQDADFPRLQVDIPVAGEMVRSAGFSLVDLQARIDSTRTPYSQELRASARVSVKARYAARRPSVNVVAILEGSDPRLTNQYVVLGAHLDHVGSQGSGAGRGIYFPGANDNASGCAAVLAIAEAFARAGPRPRRSLVFGLWSSEEAGLQGARRFAARPPVPLDSVVAYLNFDSVGHGDSIQVGGGRSHPELWRRARELDARGARLMVEETWGGGGADAAPFEEAGIANLYFASRFSYTHLHLPSDTPATLNPALLEAVARLGYRTAWSIAQGEHSGE